MLTVMPIVMFRPSDESRPPTARRMTVLRLSPCTHTANFRRSGEGVLSFAGPVLARGMSGRMSDGANEMRAAIGRNLLAAGVAAVLGAGVAHGKACNGVSFPEQVPLGSGALTLNGLGLRQATMFKVNVYVAALYVAKTSSDPDAILGSNGPYELILQFVRNIGAGDIREGWDDGFARNSKAQLPALKDRMAMLNGWMADVKTGERLAFTFTPGAGVQVDVNGTAKGTIKGDDFAKAFLSIWLGDPPNPEIKVGMLGGACP